MDRRRILGIVLLVAALAGGVLMALANPLPTDHEQWACCGGEPGVLMVARGPAFARYDEARDATLAVFECGHGHCRVATQIAGNVTDRIGGPQTLLFSPTGTPAEGEVDLSEPIAIPEGREPAFNVTTMTAARFEVGRAYVPLLMDQLLLLVGIVGAALVIRRPDSEALAGALGGAVGLFVGAQLAAAGPSLGALPPLLLALGVLAAVGAGVAARKRPRGWVAVAFLAALVAALLFSSLVTERFFVHDPVD